MKKAMRRATLIKNLESKFGIPAVPADEFYGYKNDGIW